MTRPATARVQRGRNHSYRLDGEELTGRGVTTIIGNGLPKPGLIKWAASATAGYAVDHWDELTPLGPSEKLKRLDQARYEDRDQAANRGTEVHKLAQRLVRGEEIDVPDELAGHVQAYIAFLDDYDVEPEVVEGVCFNRRHRYGGTFDLLATLTHRPSVLTRWLLDIKTNRNGPYGDNAFQLAGYRHAEFYLHPDTGAEVPMPTVARTGVVWVRGDGYDLVPFDTGPAVFREFLYIDQVAQAAERCRDYKGEPLSPPVRQGAPA